MKEQIIKTAYKISAKDLEEPWHYDDVIIYAETRGEAKSKGLQEMYNLGASKTRDYLDKYKDTDLTYTDISARRVKDQDVILFEGKEMKRNRVKEHVWCKERDAKALKLWQDNPDSLAVVYAGCYRQYWGANHSGYASDIVWAGRYTTEEAYKIVSGSSYDRQETVSLIDVEKWNENINEQVETLQKQIDRLKTKII